MIVEQSRTARERSEELERASLAAWATLAAETKGREAHEPADPHRTAFAQDIDRILASGAFGRLGDKSHSAFRPRPGRVRTRLDQTLDGVRISRTIARALRLNEDLAEAIALGRDLGHTAFAAAGEEALSVFADVPFRHHEQSIRVVERLERDGRGLNLTWEVRDGILAHAADAAMPGTVEGQAARIAARLADVAGHLEDGITGGVMDLAALPPIPTAAAPPSTPRQWIGALIDDLVAASADTPDVEFSPAAASALRLVEERLHTHVLGRPELLADRARGIHCLRSLVVFYLDHPGRLPPVHRQEGEPLVLRVLDFVAGLSDGQALRRFDRLFLPQEPASRL